MLKTLALGPTASELWITAVLPLSSDPPQLGAPPTRIQCDPQGLSSWEDALLTSLGRKGPSVVDLPPVASWSSRGMSLSGGSALTFVAGGRGRRLGGSRGKRESVLLGRGQPPFLPLWLLPSRVIKPALGWRCPGLANTPGQSVCPPDMLLWPHAHSHWHLSIHTYPGLPARGLLVLVIPDHLSCPRVCVPSNLRLLFFHTTRMDRGTAQSSVCGMAFPLHRLSRSRQGAWSTACIPHAKSTHLPAKM